MSRPLSEIAREIRTVVNAQEVMDKLYPSLPKWQREANAAWLTQTARMVKDNGVIGSPRDGWIIIVLGKDNYKIEFSSDPLDP